MIAESSLDINENEDDAIENAKKLHKHQRFALEDYQSLVDNL
jgi:hypothetical protein